MANCKTNRTFLRGGIAAALIILPLLLPAAAVAAPSGDEDSYAYPLIGKFSRTDTGGGITVKEKGENYGAGVFFRLPVSSRMEGSPNVEAATEDDRRFIANFRAEVNFIRADLNASAGNASSFDNTTYRGIRTTSAKGESKYRVLHCDGDLGYRIKASATGSFEPFAGLGFIYTTRDIDGNGFSGHTTYSTIINGRVGVRGEYELGRDTVLFGEAGIRIPVYTRIKENLAPSVSFHPGMAFSDSETAGIRYAQYRLFLFHERLAFKTSASGNGMLMPDTKQETVGLMIGLGY